MPSEESTRDQAQRRMLVALADSAPLARRRPRALLAVAVFALSGALTGAAVSAAALTADAPNVSRQVPTTAMLSTLVPGSTQLFAKPFIIENGSGPAALDVGPAPEGATELFLSFGCLDAGTHTTSIDGVVSSIFACDGPSLGSGGGRAVIGAGPHTVRVEGEGAYVLWASWSAPAVPPEASAEQSAALADGAVTEAEYREGFARYQQCMADAGYPVDVADAPGPLISYTTSGAAHDSGAEEACYAADFRLIDMAFQAANK
ncbi:hypothetical protein N1027_11695 [Herbiconiux sp. CPCC 205763]|uniref:Uncharacterized protein n=1 Tax=Herbiconiux aconitum TaxID=2970913 RepID=A0ABT2GRE1_9MICO|nr:hypothetical protein [Herbiconiux aconitum]MCS5718797.1 hypothetical protein [Herbiconiux aconitum]